MAWIYTQLVRGEVSYANVMKKCGMLREAHFHKNRFSRVGWKNSDMNSIIM